MIDTRLAEKSVESQGDFFIYPSIDYSTDHVE
jgi:hypothetical protein